MPWSFKTKLLDFPISSLPVPCLGRRRPVHQHFPPLCPSPNQCPPSGPAPPPPWRETLPPFFLKNLPREHATRRWKLLGQLSILYLKLFSLKVWFDQLCWVHTKWAIDIHQIRSDHKHSEHISSTFKLKQKPGMSLSCQSIRSDVYLSPSGNCSHSW